MRSPRHFHKATIPAVAPSGDRPGHHRRFFTPNDHRAARALPRGAGIYATIGGEQGLLGGREGTLARPIAPDQHPTAAPITRGIHRRRCQDRPVARDRHGAAQTAGVRRGHAARGDRISGLGGDAPIRNRWIRSGDHNPSRGIHLQRLLGILTGQ